MEALTASIAAILITFGFLLCMLGFFVAWHAGEAKRHRNEDNQAEAAIDRRLVMIHGPGPMARHSYTARNQPLDWADRAAARLAQPQPLAVSPAIVIPQTTASLPPARGVARVPGYVNTRPAIAAAPTDEAAGQARVAGYVAQHAARRKPRALTRSAA